MQNKRTVFHTRTDVPPTELREFATQVTTLLNLDALRIESSTCSCTKRVWRRLTQKNGVQKVSLTPIPAIKQADVHAGQHDINFYKNA
jgi:hypothetical protein